MKMLKEAAIMKRWLFLLVVGSVLFMSCSDQKTTSWELLDTSDKVTESGRFVEEMEFPYFKERDRPPTGTLRFHYSTGFKSEETWEKKNGEVYISSVTWDPQGRLYTRCQTIDGNLDGPYEQYWDGKPTESGTYLNGRKIGKWTEWDARSAAFVQNIYKDGELWDGRTRILIDSSGLDITCKQGQIIEKLPCKAHLVRKCFGERYEK